MVERISHFDLGHFLDTIESAPPTAAVEVFAFELSRWLGAEHVSFLITDLSGDALVRLTNATTPEADGLDRKTVLFLAEHRSHQRALVTQRVQVSAQEGLTTFIAPVTARGDTIGVLELSLPCAEVSGLRDTVATAAHALAYVVTTERRHTDLYEWGRRSSPLSIAAEIQRRLLPSSFTCEAGPLTVSAWLEPAHDVAGDTFDYALEDDRLYLSITDAMGHEIDAAMLATLTVNALRNGRRIGEGLGEIAARASSAVFGQRHGDGFVTGLVGMVDLFTGRLSVVNGGHPPPVLVRGDRATEFALSVDLPFGVLPDRPYRVQDFALEPGDRVVFVTDGLLEAEARHLDIPRLMVASRELHPRQAVEILMDELMRATNGVLHDDAAVMCLDWYGPGHVRRSVAGELHDVPD